MLYNKGCERAVLAGLCRHGLNAYIDITDIISIDSFFDNKNQLIFKVLENLFSKDQEKIDIPSINAEAFSSGFYDRICKDQIDVEYIRSLFNYPIEYDNIRKQAQTLVKLSFARKAQESHQKACKKLDDITGSESIDEIIKLSEEPFLDLMTTITSEEGVSKIGEDIEGYLEYLEENSGKAVGVHTPFPIFNHVIGDGMRQGVHLIAARLKTGKMQPYTSTVYTPDGSKLMGELKVGDKVLTPFGDYSYVTHLFEQGMRTVYTMKFMDGSEMECGMSHIVEYTTRKGKFYKNAQLRELVNEGIKTKDGHYRFEIRIPKALSFNEKQLAIDPYTLGLMLGDKHVFENCEQKELLVFYNIEKWEDRHIPHDYMFSSIEQRTKLLKGLLDSSGEDGVKIKKFYSGSKRMLDDFVDLTRSLGAYSRIMHRVTSWAKARFDKKTKTLIDVVESKKALCRCIKLSEEHGLYITDGYTTTHNSTIGKEVAYFSAKNGIPSLYIDTEMSKEDQLNRMLASISKINIRSIEKGLYKNSQSDYKKVLAAAKEISSIPFYHKNVAGRDFSYILSVIKRWLHRHVGFEPDGSTKRHLIVYDYFKLMDQSSLKDAAEYQLMGFQIAALHDFCQKYNTPVLSFVQTNRDGITKDTTDIIAQSDRLGWNAISLSVFKRKTAEEIGVDGPENGNAKIIPLEGRFMDRLDDGDYINMYIDGSTATIKEISTKRRPKLDSGFEINDQREQDTESPDRICFDESGNN